ncbi:class I SAM-dependent methyltransferase [Flavobacteriaceae bacterium R38]|nr:class I SAM-dependent methyltransferase [Flavobacteriaceae bacterium R38]
MNRIELIQKLIDKKKYKKYLEIGTYKGTSFFPIRCKYKVAVDPKFNIPLKRKLKWIWKNPYNALNSYFEETSDSFFDNRQSYLKNLKQLDIVFIDGLHTFKASLYDALNSLNYVQEDGIIVMHDCYPPTETAGVPAESLEDAAKMNLKDWTGEWCGDVWKTIVYLKEKYPDDLEVYVIDTDYGLGVLKKKNNHKLDLQIDNDLYKKCDEIEYSDMKNNPSEVLSLRDIDFANKMIAGY